MARLSSRRRLGAVALLVGMVLLALGAGFWAWQGVEAATAERDARLDLYDTLRRANPQRLPAGLAGEIDRRDPYLAGESETLAAADMQKRIRGLIEAAGGEVFSAQLLLKSEGETPERRIELQVVFEAGIEAIQKALYEIETGAPFGFVDELAIQPARGVSTEKPEEEGRLLRSTLTVTSYWRRPA